MSDSRFVGFMNGKNKYGRWVPDKEITARAVMGGSTVDFSQAIFTHPEYAIYSKAFWGGVTIIVPPNVVVEQNGRAIMGGFAGSGGLYHSNHGRTATAASGAGITIKVNGTAMMGSINAVVNKKALPAQLVSVEEAERILREVPEAPSTTRQDMVQQTLGDVFGRLGGGGGGAPAAILQQALGGRMGACSEARSVHAVQGFPVQAFPVDHLATPTPSRAAALPTEPQKPGREAVAFNVPTVQAVDWKQELKDLKGMMDAGILSQDEFEVQKKRILAQNS